MAHSGQLCNGSNIYNLYNNAGQEIGVNCSWIASGQFDFLLTFY